MADVLTTLLCDLHRRGIYHRDMKADNITWRPGEPARLLDYETVRFPRRVSFQQRMKNLSQVNSALPDVVPNELRTTAFERYLRESSFRGDAERLRRLVIATSVNRRDRWHGC